MAAALLPWETIERPRRSRPDERLLEVCLCRFAGGAFVESCVWQRGRSKINVVATNAEALRLGAVHASLPEPTVPDPQLWARLTEELARVINEGPFGWHVQIWCYPGYVAKVWRRHPERVRVSVADWLRRELSRIAARPHAYFASLPIQLPGRKRPLVQVKVEVSAAEGPGGWALGALPVDDPERLRPALERAFVLPLRKLCQAEVDQRLFCSRTGAVSRRRDWWKRSWRSPNSGGPGARWIGWPLRTLAVVKPTAGCGSRSGTSRVGSGKKSGNCRRGRRSPCWFRPANWSCSIRRAPMSPQPKRPTRCAPTMPTGGILWPGVRSRRRTALPAEPETVALYLTDRAERLKTASLSRRITAISRRHQASGLPSPAAMQHAQVSEVWKGIQRTKGTAQQGRRPLLTADLRQMFEELPDSLQGMCDRALLLVGFAGGFRRSELAALAVGDLEETDQGLVVRLRRSKTDQAAQGRAVALPYGSDPSTCPVRALRTWLEAAAITEGFLFRALDQFDVAEEAPSIPTRLPFW